MIEQLQLILTTIGDLGQYAIWVVMGFFIWKLATLASILLVVKYGIQKLHDVIVHWGTRPVENVTHFDLNNHVFQADGEGVKFIQLIDMLHTTGGKSSRGLRYIHDDHVQFALDAIQEKKKREEETKV